MADDNAAQAAPKANDNNKNAPVAPDLGGAKKVRLLARLWMRPVPDTSPIKYQRYQKGAVLEVSEEEFTQLNAFRKTFEEVEE
jgi:hypothetical protein